MLAEVDFLRSQTSNFISEDFSAPGINSVWSHSIGTGGPSASPTQVQRYIYGDTSTGFVGLQRQVPTALDTTAYYKMKYWLVPYQGSFAGTYDFYARLNSASPSLNTDGVRARLVMADATGAFTLTFSKVIAGVRTSSTTVTGTVLGSDTFVKPFGIELWVHGNDVAFYMDHSASVIDAQTYDLSAGSPGTRFGFGLTASLSGGRCIVEHFELLYQDTSISEKNRSMLVMSVNGSLYREYDSATSAAGNYALGELLALSSSQSLASDRNLTGLQRLQKLYIADNAAPRRSGSVLQVEDLLYAVTNAQSTTTTCILTIGAHLYQVGMWVKVQLDPPNAVFDGLFKVSAVAANTITYAKTNYTVANTAYAGKSEARTQGVKVTVTSGTNDWTGFGIEVSGDQLVITGDATLGGTYRIQKAGTTALLLSDPVTGLPYNTGVSGLTYQVVRAPKIYDAVLDTLTGWYPTTATATTATIVGRTLTANVVTITTASTHSYAVGDKVTIALTPPDERFDGTFVIDTAPTATTFTYLKSFATAIIAVAPVLNVRSKEINALNVARVTTAAAASPTLAITDHIQVALDPPDALYDGNRIVTAIGGGNTWFEFAVVSAIVASVEAKGTATSAGGTVTKVPSALGVMPYNQSGLAVYRDRMVLFGYDHQVYFSRQSNPLDWNYGADGTDAQRAYVLTLSNASGLGKRCTAAIPLMDSYMVLGCVNSLWMLRGDATNGGELVALSRSVGIIDRNAWCRSPEGHLVWLSQNGLYGLGTGGSIAGSASLGTPEPLSRNKLPLELLNVDTNNYTVLMAWNNEYQGVDIWLTPANAGSTIDGTGLGGTLHWFFDWETKGFWPVTYSSPNFDPFCCLAHSSDDSWLSGVIFGCRDGYIRRQRDFCESDDGLQLYSYITYGPFRIAGPMDEGIVHELNAATAAGSGTVTWALYPGTSEEAAYPPSATAFASGAWSTQGRNYTDRPRMRCAAMALALVNLSYGRAWAMEEITAMVDKAGRQRLL